jgi:hypothetical protein
MPSAQRIDGFRSANKTLVGAKAPLRVDGVTVGIDQDDVVFYRE